ncbi:MAG: PASTA domain-containing protein, partial [Prevotellaceae bacterium]|nr:PASTA domain-containing protein [Prevotellaceae bacterium]
LKGYTRHGEFVEVPDLKGLYEHEAEVLLLDNNLKYEVIDSVYLRNGNAGAIVEQTPKAGSKVKFERIIYLTINAKAKKQVALPNIIKNVSKRQAVSMLEMFGFKIGDVEVVPSENGDEVLEVKYQGHYIAVGEQLPDGAALSLVVGDNSDSGEITVIPILTGLNTDEAEAKIRANNLIFGYAEYDAGDIKESDKPLFKVYRQEPSAGEQVNFGKRVNIWLSKDTKKIQQAEQQQQHDEFF